MLATVLYVFDVSIVWDCDNATSGNRRPPAVWQRFWSILFRLDRGTRPIWVIGVPIGRVPNATRVGWPTQHTKQRERKREKRERKRKKWRILLCTQAKHRGIFQYWFGYPSRWSIDTRDKSTMRKRIMRYVWLVVGLLLPPFFPLIFFSFLISRHKLFCIESVYTIQSTRNLYWSICVCKCLFPLLCMLRTNDWHIRINLKS